jgi:hypothetical protein
VKIDSFKKLMTTKYGSWEKYLDKVEESDGPERRKELEKQHP